MLQPTQNSSTFATAFGDPEEVHPVLIAGAGPAGTLLAFCLAKFGVRSLIVDSNHFADHEWGRGDALLGRTVEVLRSLGVGETLIAAGNRICERSFWDMTATPPTCKTISDYFPSTLDIEDAYALSMRQGLVEKILSDATTALGGVSVLRPFSVIDARLDETDPDNQPAIATLKSPYGEIREVKARYVVACDGGHSAVRRAVEKYGVTLDGDAHDSMWSAMDVVGFRTDFPDIKKVSVVASAHGTIMVIPRENIHGKNCLRFYCEVERGRPPALEDVVATIHKVFAPFKFTWDSINWFTIYTVGQRITSAFDVKQRIFLTGDAAHLHSPKGALGMNTSLMDAHNLAVKIALVERGIAQPAILGAYALERRAVAMNLMEMDAKLIRLFAAHGKQSKGAEDQQEDLVAFQQNHFAYSAGTNITYAPNALVAAVPHAPSPAVRLIGGEGLLAGRRLLPAIVKRFSDGLQCKILDAAPCDGRFTLFLCLGDLTAPGRVAQLEALRDLVHRPDGVVARLDTVQGKGGAASVLRLVGVTTTSAFSAEAAALLYGRLGLRTFSEIVPGAEAPRLFDTSALYTDDVVCLSPYLLHTELEGQGPPAGTDVLSVKAAAGILLHPLHQKWDVDIGTGGIVVVRPDGHVGTLTRALDAQAWLAVEDYFKGFLAL
ncbi:FAD binding domain-containing protein [Mycena epipterygia]|nr:FAD binding domain-containing protein [Mycena epipterygia]